MPLSANIYLFKFKHKNTRTKSITSVWCFYGSLWTYFTHFSNVSIIYFELVNVTWLSAFEILLMYHVKNQLLIKIYFHKEQSQQWKHQNNTVCEKWSKLTIKTPKLQQWDCSGIFIVNVDQICCLGYTSMLNLFKAYNTTTPSFALL